MTISLMGINYGRSVGLSGFPIISMNLHGILLVMLMLKSHTHVVFLKLSYHKCCRKTCIPDPKGLVDSILWPPSDFGMESQTTRIIPRVSGRCIGWNFRIISHVDPLKTRKDGFKAPITVHFHTNCIRETPRTIHMTDIRWNYAHNHNFTVV